MRACATAIDMNFWREKRGNHISLAYRLQRHSSHHCLLAKEKCSCQSAAMWISDGCRWRCPDCKKAVSIRNGTLGTRVRIFLLIQERSSAFIERSRRTTTYSFHTFPPRSVPTGAASATHALQLHWVHS